jgi:hypothetical protein
MCCAPEEIAFGDLFRVLLPKAFIPLRVMGHFSLFAYESSAFTATKLKCPPDFVRKAFVRGMRTILSLLINKLFDLFANCPPAYDGCRGIRLKNFVCHKITKATEFSSEHLACRKWITSPFYSCGYLYQADGLMSEAIPPPRYAQVRSIFCLLSRRWCG